jgi:hypothetical protein
MAGRVGPELAVAGAPGAPPSDQPARLHPAVWGVAAALVALELAVSARYGFHRDELYFVVAGRHLAAGYVDQPPLAPLLTRVATGLWGTSPSAVRVFPALAGAGVVIAGAVTARLLGGRGVAQVLTALAVACAPVTLAAAHLANTTVYDLLAWSVAIACVVAAVSRGRSKAWVGAGVAVGLGLENKDLLLLAVVAVAVGILATGPREVFTDRWLWAGAAIALVLWSPNLAWQTTHGWPELTMSRSLRRQHSTGSDYATVLPAQVVYVGLAAAPLAVVGVRRLLRDRALRYLAVAVAVVVAFVVLDIPGRAYYTDGLMPLVFAAGAVTVEQRRPSFRAARAWLAAPVTGLTLGVVLILPILPPLNLAHIHGIHKLNYDLTETIGWPQLADQLGAMYRSLPADERARTSIYTANYGEASALILYGTRLPPVLSAHNTWWLWGPGRAPDSTVLTVGAAGQLAPYFAHCTSVASYIPPHDVPNDENGVEISHCTGPRAPWSGFWHQLKHYD